MKGGATALAILVLLATAHVPVGGAAPTTVPRGPIKILADVDFTAANGVVSGTGTPADPFVISGWEIRSTLGHAIVITNVTKSFVVRGNLVDGASAGIFVSSSTGVGLVTGNQITARVTGVTVNGANVTVEANDFLRGSPTAVGVSLYLSSSVVANNTFVYICIAVTAAGGSPVIVGNDIHASVTGIRVRTTANAHVGANTITQTGMSIDVRETTRTAIHSNNVTGADLGLYLIVNKDLDVRNNTVRGSVKESVVITTGSGNFTANHVLDGKVDAVVMTSSPMLVASNRIESHLGVGLKLTTSAADVTTNLLIKNHLGIRLVGGSVAHLTGNVLVDNAIGLDVPYESRQAVTHMSANVVNGVNVDGSLVASERVYHYMDANVVVSGQVRDSGFSAGAYGSLTAQGNLVLYEVDTATVTGTVISHATVGVTAVNSFNVIVEGSTILNTQTGVVAEARAVLGPVPACAVSVKNSTIGIVIDPPATVGVDARACLVLVSNTTIHTVDTGIRMDVKAWGNLSSNTITGTRVGLDVWGAPGDVSIVANALVANRVGARFSGSTALVLDNRIENNTVAGIQLDAAARLQLAGNRVSGNAEGIIDLRSCADLFYPGACSRLDAEANVIVANRGDGIRVNGTSNFRGDVFLSNRGTGLRAGATTLVGVEARGNAGDGASITGDFSVRNSNFTANVHHGLRFVGSGTIRSSNFTLNGEAGIRATATYAIAVDINASYNQDGLLFDELVPLPGVPTLPPIGVPRVAFQPPQQDPMDIHRSVMIHNSRDAIRAGAAVVNATHNWFGGAPVISIADQVGGFQNGISPTVRFMPYYTDRAMTTTGPVNGL